MPKVRVLMLDSDSDNSTLSYNLQDMKLLHLTQPTVDRLINKSKDTLTLQSMSVDNSTLTPLQLLIQMNKNQMQNQM